MRLKVVFARAIGSCSPRVRDMSMKTLPQQRQGENAKEGQVRHRLFQRRDTCTLGDNPFARPRRSPKKHFLSNIVTIEPCRVKPRNG